MLHQIAHSNLEVVADHDFGFNVVEAEAVPIGA
jgi:hypothetical protein